MQESSSGGEQIWFVPKGILYKVKSATPTTLPDNYVVTNTGGQMATESAPAQSKNRLPCYHATYNHGDDYTDSSNEYHESQGSGYYQ